MCQAFGPLTNASIEQVDLQDGLILSPGTENENSESVGLATFAHVLHAFYAKNNLDNITLSRDNAKLKVQFFNHQNLPQNQ